MAVSGPLRKIIRRGEGREGEWTTYDVLECGHWVEAAYDYIPTSRRCEECGNSLETNETSYTKNQKTKWLLCHRS